MFIDKLIDKIKKYNNPTVAGLDPKLESIPKSIVDCWFKECGESLQAAANAIIEFNKKLIDAIHDIVPAIKPQLAYYEMYGLEGIRAYLETINYANEKGMIIITDGKRNDIGSTSEAYSKAYLGKTRVGTTYLNSFESDALTVNPYLGVDGISPFLEDCKEHGKGLFVLVKTSNPSSGQLQDLTLSNGKPVFSAVADLVKDWGSELIGKNGYSSVGAVVGATWPKQAAELRKLMPNSYFLVPGYGAQGGTAKDIAVNFNNDGLGAIVNASRSIMFAYSSERWSKNYSEDDFALASRAEVLRMRDDINQVI